MYISAKKIKALDPCEDGYSWYLEHGTKDLLSTLLLVNKEHPGWARWLFTKLMNRKQCIRIAIYSAELVLDRYEKQHGDDKRPREAIKAAKAVLRRNSAANRIKAYANAYAANYAAAAAYAAAAYAAYAAADRTKIQEKIIRKAVSILNKG